MAAVLACGEGALLSHESAAAVWGIRPSRRGPIHVSVPRSRDGRHDGIRVHRRRLATEDRLEREGIPVTSPLRTLVDIASGLTDRQLERAVNEADKLDLINPEELRAGIEGRRAPGVRKLKKLLDNPTFVLTDSELEQRFVPIAMKAGLPKPETQVTLNGHRVDFYFREACVVVETDGLRYHRTPTQQHRDRVRDQELTSAGLTVLRFTHAQIRYEPDHVGAILARTATARDPVGPRDRGGRMPPPSRRGRAESA